MDRLEEIRIKNCAFLTHGEKDWLISEIERLKKEKEWLIKLLYKKICATPITLDAYRRSITDLMQQALKEG